MPLSEAEPSSSRPVRAVLAVAVVAVCVRAAGAWALGEGAPFGPDGTGAQASLHLGGHPYPLHTAALHLTGDARLLSVLSGTVLCAALWAWGRRMGLGGAGGWLCALLPGAVYTGALSAGDAPALCLVVIGALLATGGTGLQVLGGALALASVAVKPIALPALVLLLPRPVAFVGVALAAPMALRWLGPLVSPLPQGGLLGTWWVASGGTPPGDAAGWRTLIEGGAQALVAAPLWACAGLAPAALLGVVWPRQAGPQLAVLTRLCGLAALGGLVTTAALFGDRLEPRYLVPSVVALLPWVGAVVPRTAALLLLWPTVAVLTQVGAERSLRDPDAQVPELPVLGVPAVDARQLFEEASTEGATALRDEALQLAETLPEGAEITVEQRAHDRQGELTWPLQVLRPDVKIRVVQP